MIARTDTDTDAEDDYEVAAARMAALDLAIDREITRSRLNAKLGHRPEVDQLVLMNIRVRRVSCVVYRVVSSSNLPCSRKSRGRPARPHEHSCTSRIVWCPRVMQCGLEIGFTTATVTAALIQVLF